MLYFSSKYFYSGLCAFGLPNTWGLRTRTGDQRILRLVPVRACIARQQGDVGPRQWARAEELGGQRYLLLSSQFLRARFAYCLRRHLAHLFCFSSHDHRTEMGVALLHEAPVHIR